MGYSQRDEETHILAACASVTNKRLLDIGAFHPTCMSNSRALIEAGWEALLIEPSPGPVRELVKAYGSKGYEKSVDIICAAVSVEYGLMELCLTDDGLSTDTIRDQWRETGGYYGSMYIHCMTIADIIHHFGGFSFVSIDTEGTSVDLFKVLIATEMYPQCICVEHDNRILEAMQAARARGYKPIYESTENLVFSL